MQTSTQTFFYNNTCNLKATKTLRVIKTPAFHRIETDDFEKILSNKMISSFQKIVGVYIEGNKNRKIDLSSRKLSKMFDCARRSIERAKSFLLSQVS